MGNVTPHAATPPARMAVVKTRLPKRILERAALLAVDAVGLAMTRIGSPFLPRPVTERHGEGARGESPAPTRMAHPTRGCRDP